ncbi:DUF4145 domain-containing protein [Nocardia sp. NPDC002869]|uniref:DUF4145 domain-containing protein n=1 Tax=Nocardia sp. NPDC002869 TaxID=3161032 RepID=UPI00398D24C3
MEWEDRLGRVDVLPKILRRALDEVEKCMDGGSYIMAIVAARRGLEALCLDQGATERTLEKRLEKLQTTGKIDGRLFTWATHLRNIGNEGAHDLDFDPDRDEALDSQNLLERVVQYVYIDQARYEEAKRRWEYRQLPAVDVKYRVDEHTNGCYLVVVRQPAQALKADEEARVWRWTRHSNSGISDPWSPPGHGVNIEDSAWAFNRAAVIKWLKDRNLRVKEWTKEEGKRLDECTAGYHTGDDEPPF